MTGFCVTPVNTIVDKSVIENANGKTPLWRGVANGFKNMFFRPKIFFTAYEFKWILAVYQSTYIASNLADHYVVPWLDPAVSKLLTVFVVNTTLGLLKDKALTQRFGHGDPRPFPWSSLNLFFMRDLIAMASAFTLPSILGHVMHKKFNFSENTALILAQLSTPVLAQIVCTPLHLLGLDLYNKPGITMDERLRHVRKIYGHTTLIRMLRFLPAFGIGGVVNIELRKYLVNKEH